MKRSIFATGLVLSVVICTATISGCSLFGSKFGGGADSYVGTMSFGFEESAFRPCDRTEQWWIVGGEVVVDLQSKYNDFGVNWYEPVYAELKGDPSNKGEFGHLGAYEREFEVSDVVEVRLLEPGECPR